MCGVGLEKLSAMLSALLFVQVSVNKFFFSFWLVFCARSSQVGVGPEQHSWRMPASGSKEETFLSPFTSVKPGVTLLWLCSLLSFLSSEREENKISLMFFNIFSSQCPLTSFPSPTVTLPKSNLSLTKFEIKLGIMN